MKIKLSPAQFIALLWMIKHGNGRVVRWNGGFWTVEKMQERGHFTQRDGYRVPQWYAGVGTLMALERMGLVKREGETSSLRYWEAPRVVTDAGRAAVEDAAIAGELRGKILTNLKLWRLQQDLKMEERWTSVS